MIRKQKSKIKVSVVIVNWNGKKWLKESIDSLVSQDYDNLEIIVVDNNSSDDSLEFLTREYGDDVIVIENNDNVGFGRANNIGVKKSIGELIFFLNNDTRFSRDLISKLVNFKKENKLNIVGPRVLNENGIDLMNSEYLGMDFIGSPGGPTKKMFYVDGCSLMIGREDFEKLRYFDETYFMYSEDIDLCWRARIFGMSLDICEDAKLIHYGGGSSEKTNNSGYSKHVVPVWRRFEVDKNTMRNILKNYRFINLLWVLPILAIQNFSESSLYLLTGNREAAKVSFRALKWNIENISDTLENRRYIQKNRKIGDAKIFKNIDFIPNKIKAFSRVGIPKFK